MSATYKVGIDTGYTPTLATTGGLVVLAEAPTVWPTGSTGDQLEQTLVGGFRTFADIISFIGSNDGPFVWNSGTITTSTPGLAITETWNAGGVTFDALTIDITATASAAGSRVIYITVGASPVFTVTKAGAVTAASTFTGTTLGLGTPAIAQAAILITQTGSGATGQYGILSDYTGSSAATVSIRSGHFRASSAAAVYTAAEVTGVFIATAVKGAASTITIGYGLKIDDQTAASTNYAIFTGAGLVQFGDAVRVNAGTSLGTAAGTDQTVIDGTNFGAGVASLRLNGLTTAAINNQLGTLTNAPSAGDPVFWAPVSIAGSIRYVPMWA